MCMVNVHASEMGKKGGPARAKVLTPERRKEIARMGGLAHAKKNYTKNMRHRLGK